MAGSSIAMTSAGGSAGGAPASLAKAYLSVHEPLPGSGAGAKPGPETGQIAFQFNPNELTLAKSARWKTEPARGAKKASPPEFQAPNRASSPWRCSSTPPRRWTTAW